MPSIVKSKSDEALWARAKIQAAKQGQGKNYAYITEIFQRMKVGGSEKTASADELFWAAAMDELEKCGGFSGATKFKDFIVPIVGAFKKGKATVTQKNILKNALAAKKAGQDMDKWVAKTAL